jgi:glutathione S-transferase
MGTPVGCFILNGTLGYVKYEIKDARALVRLQVDHVSRTVIPAFYRYLQAQETNDQIEGAKEFSASLHTLIDLFERAEKQALGGGGAAGVGEARAMGLGLGLWAKANDDLNLTDVMVGPCEALASSFTVAIAEQQLRAFLGLFRASNVLKHYRGFAFAHGDRFNEYLARLFSHPNFKATCSTEKLYLDSYERWVWSYVHLIWPQYCPDMPSTDPIQVRSRTPSTLVEAYPDRCGTTVHDERGILI